MTSFEHAPKQVQNNPIAALLIVNLIIPSIIAFLIYFSFHFEPHYKQGIWFGRLPSSIGDIAISLNKDYFFFLLVTNICLWRALPNYKILLTLCFILNLGMTAATGAGSFMTSLEQQLVKKQ